MKKLFKKTSAIVFIIIGMTVTLTGCGTEADSSSMKSSSLTSGSLK